MPPIPVYASFTINCTNLPAASNYFAHFYVNNTTFHTRVWCAPGSVSSSWKLGVTGASGTAGLVHWFPADLARSNDYQVVVGWNPTTSTSPDGLASKTGYLWVNPTNQGDVTAASGDSVTETTNSIAYAFRNVTGTQAFLITNLAVSTTWDEAATNVWSTNHIPPVIALSPKSGNYFVGDPITLTALAGGQGQADLTYQWQKGPSYIPSANSTTYSIPSAVTGDSGNYTFIATTPYGLSATSTVAVISVVNPPIPPVISTNLVGSTNLFDHQDTSLHFDVTGPPTITYLWYFTNTALSDGGVFSGAASDTLSISDVFSNNANLGAYYLVATNPNGSSTSKVVTVRSLGPVTITFLRTLTDGNFIATNTSSRWQVTGLVTTFTNLTLGDTSSYYLYDGTASINIFTTHGGGLNGSPLIRPNQGDVVTFKGFMQSFLSNLELEGDGTDPTTSYTFLSNNIAALPASKVIPFNITNNLAYCETNLEGSIVMLTNVWFTTNWIGSPTLGPNGETPTNGNNTGVAVIATNAAGEQIFVAFSQVDLDTAGRLLPSFARSIIGVFTQSQGNGVTPRNGGYQVAISRFSDIVTDAPPDITASISHSGKSTTLTWPLAARDSLNYSYGSNYSYSVLAATNVTGPYAPETTYQAILAGSNEVPPVVSSGTGIGTVILSPDLSTITVDLCFSGLSSTATLAHIHGPGAPGSNAGVLFGPFSGLPSATSGCIPEQSFSITPTELGYLQNGLLYFNVHDVNNGGGEIRGWIYPVPSVGLTTPNTATTGTYTDPAATSNPKFYRVVSP
jgi:hypothetical protein